MRTVFVALIMALLVVAPAMAQTPDPTRPAVPEVQQRSMAEGVLHGQTLADGRGTGGSFAGGFAGGIFLGLIGTGIAYAAQNPSELPMHERVEAQWFGSEYVLGLQQGYADRTRSRKRSSALTGGLLGTATLVVLVMSSGS
jgi:hypothetical protein